MPIRTKHPISSSVLAGLLAVLLTGGAEAKTVSGIHQEFLKTKLEAVKGSAESQHRLGVLYERGLGVAKDEKEAGE
ncbi:MAG: SEL1-like repeat protein [Verrucomicrobia bacterium]|nr:SEL1-like repeat protein [Verrucomicrobiota bacterium]